MSGTFGRNVGVKQANFVPHLRQSDGEVHRQRGLSHATFARTYGKDDIDSGQRLRSLCRLTGMLGHVCVQGITLQKMIAIMRLTPKLDYTGGDGCRAVRRCGGISRGQSARMTV